jgi:acetylornithine/succinyldiaminopimelate/putrescine aminotransferase
MRKQRIAVLIRSIRLAPPLVISEEDLDWGLDRIEAAIG